MQKGILFLWTEGGNSFLSVCGWFSGCGFSTGSKAHRQGIFFLHQKHAGEWLCHEVYRKAVDVVVALHT